MQRVMVIGGSGSGKSTVARKLGDITGLPVVHIDKIHWLPGWVERPETERYELIRDIVATEQWIFDGNYSSTFELRTARADTIVFLDISTPRRVARVLWRTVSSYGRTRPDMTQDCPERLDSNYVSFVVNWVARYHFRGARARAIALVEKARSKATVHHLKSPRDVRRFLADIAAALRTASLPKTAPEGAAGIPDQSG